ncbi:septum formation inhibitor Maf [Filobacillus milosensis]|uniref:dTTP/UTP pyrophosphatase n=1 Tax=Filobacillus milosensis TaxID=94137 RepID=A0A4Y8IF55_9BACI|nr:Maf family protein [Filobacillus milosensis]TFB18534.1 septum formation inhibitor Maf [Filobacillus milosensis]
MPNKLVLASGSPRRKELLNQVNIPFSIRKHNFDETLIKTTNPEEKVKELALHKGRAVTIKANDEIILSADTVVSYRDEIFEKPKNKEEAFEMISKLSGDIHEVYSGVMIRSKTQEVLLVEQTKVEFWSLSDAEIETYISTEDPYDKAGSYGIQSIGAMFVKQIIGDYYNVVGLPVSRVVRELREFNISPKY